MKLIVGLGNPGAKYATSRHNTGFMTLQQVANQLAVTIDRSQFNALTGTVLYQGEKVMLMLPQTFMNESGLAVRPALDYYQLTTDDLLVIYDDMDLVCGQIRLRPSGSAGGHNGIKSIIAQLGTSTFPRIRIGIGHQIQSDTIDYVLGRYDTQQEPLVLDAQKRAAQAAVEFINQPFSEVMKKYNQNRGEGESLK
jgi:PTH1 family peptidyl-tRNA hydrolase